MFHVDIHNKHLEKWNMMSVILLQRWKTPIIYKGSFKPNMCFFLEMENAVASIFGVFPRHHQRSPDVLMLQVL